MHVHAHVVSRLHKQFETESKRLYLSYLPLVLAVCSCCYRRSQAASFCFSLSRFVRVASVRLQEVLQDSCCDGSCACITVLIARNSNAKLPLERAADVCFAVWVRLWPVQLFLVRT